ncbi:serine protease [Actinosynnema sp. ALI-1.44]|uniref:S1 family peptidase n=1 Tax=Actinosynnema sp. ALI-1.44 TaxID=1933779 RepID=UPI00097C45E3|nr:serine protease [Actinosynnema sp. ALI-1.44]
MRLRKTLSVSVAVAAVLAMAPPALAVSYSTGLLDAMAKDLAITTGQAHTLIRQEAAAARTAPQAERVAGEAFGGSWFDPARGRLVVGLTDQSKAAAVEATGADTVPVAVSARQLDAVKARIDQRKAPAAVHSWHADPRTGSVVITVDDDTASDVTAFLDAARAAGPVTVRTTTAPRPRTFAAGTVGGDPYHINGNTRCSIGFSVVGGFVSAGHCGGVNSNVTGWDGSQMGTFAGSSFPGNDYAYIRTGWGWWNVGVVLGWGQVPDQLVRGSWEAPVGSSVCRSGSTTHWHCGQIQAKNETVNYQQGAFHGATKTSVCAEPGDSGGSFITGDQAQGVTSGGWGNCSGGGQTWFQPVNEILSTYGLQLSTL